jgi:hypothetical protein
MCTEFLCLNECAIRKFLPGNPHGETEIVLNPGTRSRLPTRCILLEDEDLVLGVGIGTIVNFLRRSLDAIGKAARDLSERFADQNLREKYTILEEKFSVTATSVPSAKDPGGAGSE